MAEAISRWQPTERLTRPAKFGNDQKEIIIYMVSGSWKGMRLQCKYPICKTTKTPQTFHTVQVIYFQIVWHSTANHKPHANRVRHCASIRLKMNRSERCASGHISAWWIGPIRQLTSKKTNKKTYKTLPRQKLYNKMTMIFSFLLNK